MLQGPESDYRVESPLVKSMDGLVDKSPYVFGSALGLLGLGKKTPNILYHQLRFFHKDNVTLSTFHQF